MQEVCCIVDMYIYRIRIVTLNCKIGYTFMHMYMYTHIHMAYRYIQHVCIIKIQHVCIKNITFIYIHVVCKHHVYYMYMHGYNIFIDIPPSFNCTWSQF